MKGKTKDKPAYPFIKALEQIDLIDEAEDLYLLIDVLKIDEHLYTTAQIRSIGTKLNEKYITLVYGFSTS